MGVFVNLVKITVLNFPEIKNRVFKKYGKILIDNWFIETKNSSINYLLAFFRKLQPVVNRALPPVGWDVRNHEKSTLQTHQKSLFKIVIPYSFYNHVTTWAHYDGLCVAENRLDLEATLALDVHEEAVWALHQSLLLVARLLSAHAWVE